MKPERARVRRQAARAAVQAAAVERARLTADLHDGLLQSLTGVSLKLATVARLLDTDPAAARTALTDVADVLYGEQRELRFLVEELKEGWSARREDAPPLPARLSEFSRRLHKTWDIQLLSYVTGCGELPERLARPLFGIVHEAVVNAVRHGEASAATVRIDIAAHHATVHIHDNGRGLAFQGRLEDAALRSGVQGPAVLMHRVWSLGGTLSVESTGNGVGVTIHIPFAERA
jgi:signal transduction histidine kinase